MSSPQKAVSYTPPASAHTTPSCTLDYPSPHTHMIPRGQHVFPIVLAAGDGDDATAGHLHGPHVRVQDRDREACRPAPIEQQYCGCFSSEQFCVRFPSPLPHATTPVPCTTPTRGHVLEHVNGGQHGAGVEGVVDAQGASPLPGPGQPEQPTTLVSEELLSPNVLSPHRASLSPLISGGATYRTAPEPWIRIASACVFVSKSALRYT